MTCEVKIVEHTTNKSKEIVTFQLRYWRAVHGEVLTHRVLSRNASSSRAIPVMKTLSQVWNDPAGPVHWGKHQAGMQSFTELAGWRKALAKFLWKSSAKVACVFAYSMFKLGGAKQWVNRILEPWQYIHVIVTATELDNFFELRCHKDAQPEFQELACKMREALKASTPRVAHKSSSEETLWHLPYVSQTERELHPLDLLLKLSAARCARVSYLTHDGKAPQISADVALYERLVGSKPAHSSPVEHQAKAATAVNKRSNNFVGWVQHRALLEKSNG